MEFNRIFVIADRDDRRQRALRAALDVARVGATRIRLVGFVHDALADNPRLLAATAARRLQSGMLADKRSWLEAAAAKHAAAGVAIEIDAVWTKDVGTWVRDNVTPKDWDLLVKSAHRSESLLYTPTDWRLLRESPVPVLVARDRLRKRPGRVLATIDLDTDQPVQKALNRRVLAAAAAAAERIGAALHVVYAIPVSTLAQDLDLVDSRALERRTAKRLAGQVAALAEECGLPPDRISIKAGPPERVVDGVASRLKVALVVMGTIGRKGLKGRLLGNTAEKVLHANRSNLLALRPDN